MLFQNKLSKIKIHENIAGGIYVVGVTSKSVTSENDVSYNNNNYVVIITS